MRYAAERALRALQMTLSQGRNSPEPSYHTLEVDEREWTRKVCSCSATHARRGVSGRRRAPAALFGVQGCYLPRGERFSTKESDHIPPSAPGTAVRPTCLLVGIQSAIEYPYEP